VFNFKKNKKEEPGVRRSVGVGSSRIRKSNLGTWKLVYADFMTVLMAFFLITWVLLWDKVSKIPERDMSCIEGMAQNLREQISQDRTLARGAVPIDIDLLPDGLRLTLLDNNQPMFERGRADLSSFAKAQFQKIASAVNLCPENQIVIEGYTDAMPFASGLAGYSNWELSADRANAARRELILQQVEDTRIASVTGYAGTRPSIVEDPTNPLNRRISITVIPGSGVLPGDKASEGNTNKPPGS
jgi:chemotaxis protein MotB